MSARNTVTRRALLTHSGALLVGTHALLGKRSPAQTKTNNLIKPLALRPGDTVGVIAPATSVSDPDRLALVGRTLAHFGLRPKMGRHAQQRMGDYRASVAARLDDLHAMFRDPEVRGIFCVRGGYGAAHLLDRIDYDLVRRHPKVFVGYSDITALHLAIHHHAGLVTFHGPILLSDFPEYTERHYRQALFDAKPPGKLSNPPGGDALRPTHTLRAIRGGTATGQLIGGNLTLITAALGTPYEIDTRERILFLEDVDEEPYSIDRMLTQLRLAGKLKDAAGVIFGECENCGPRDYKPSMVLPYSLGEVLDNVLTDARGPVLAGLTIGHTSDQLTLPLGVRATLDADRGTLELHESGVSLRE